jgi:hypothetical protein
MRRGADAQIRLTANFAYLGPLANILNLTELVTIS